MAEPEGYQPTPDQVFALVPDRFGLAVVAVGDLADRLTDGEELEEAITNCAIDSQGDRDLPALIERVRQLNRTGDANAYWGLGHGG